MPSLRISLENASEPFLSPTLAEIPSNIRKFSSIASSCPAVSVFCRLSELLNKTPVDMVFPSHGPPTCGGKCTSGCNGTTITCIQ